MKIMITGGGTGGHTSPAVAIVDELQRRDPHLLAQWVGRRGGIEERVAASMAVPFRAVPIEGWPRRNKLRRVWSAGKLGLGYLRALMLVRKFRPDVVVGVGGYVSVPVGLAAQHLGVPVVLHEQNKRLGMANRILARRATRVLLSYPDTLGEYPRDRSLVVGNPVRGAFLRPPSQEDARNALGLDPAVPVVLVSGGSQGARSINEALAEVATQMSADEMQLVWAAGPAHVATFRSFADNRPHIRLSAFIDDMATACAAADVIVGRAGASTAAEIAVLGKPAILIPYPHATDNHQEQNAGALEAVGGAVVLHDGDCTGARLLSLLRDLLADPGRLERMSTGALSMARPAAVDAIAEEILGTAFGEEPMKSVE